MPSKTVSLAILDTSVYIDNFRTGRFTQKILASPFLFRGSSVVIHELLRGAQAATEQAFARDLATNLRLITPTAKDWQDDELAMKRVEMAVITFGPVEIVNDFHTVSNFSPIRLKASGTTPMGEAIRQGLELIRRRKEEYRTNGIAFYRPWIFLITDGGPTDEWQGSAATIKEGETSNAFAFFAVGVQNARMDLLKRIAVREPLKLQGLKFRELFLWLSNSMKSVSRSTPGTTVSLPPPSGWAEV